MRTSLPTILALAATAPPAIAAPSVGFGANAVVTGVACITVDLSGGAKTPAATFLSSGDSFVASVKLNAKYGEPEGPSDSKTSNRTGRPEQMLSKGGASSAAQVIGTGAGTAGIMMATGRSAFDRVYNGFIAKAADNMYVRLASYSALECTFNYTLVAWVSRKTTAVPGEYGAVALLRYGQTGQTIQNIEWANAWVGGGSPYRQQIKTATFRLSNPSNTEIVVSGVIEAVATGGRVAPYP